LPTPPAFTQKPQPHFTALHSAPLRYTRRTAHVGAPGLQLQLVTRGSPVLLLPVCLQSSNRAVRARQHGHGGAYTVRTRRPTLSVQSQQARGPTSNRNRCQAQAGPEASSGLGSFCSVLSLAMLSHGGTATVGGAVRSGRIPQASRAEWSVPPGRAGAGD
jgi:hypothetical protein